MLLNQASLAATHKGFRALIKGEMPRVKSFWEQVAMETKSTGSSEDYHWAENLDGMSEWVTDRTLSNIKVAKFTITNKDWQRAVNVHKNLIEDDKLGLITPMIKSLAHAMPAHWDKMVALLLLNAFTTGLSYDGKAFFATDHDSGSNKGTVALTDANYEAAVQAMMSQVGDDDEPLDIFPTILLCGPANRAKAKKLLKAEKLSSGASNVNYNEVTLFVTPRITNNSWYLLDCSKPFRSLIVQKRSKTEPRWIVEPGQKVPEGTYGYDGRYNAGYGLHQLAWGSTAGS